MQFLWTDIVTRARVYVDDDNSDTDGWIAPANWLTLAQVEYAQLYRRWVRAGLISPATVDQTFTGATTTVTGVLAVVGVGQDTGMAMRVLTPAQSSRGKYPYWQSTGQSTGLSTSWMATGGGDTVTFTLDPKDPSGTYFVRYVPTIPYATLLSAVPATMNASVATSGVLTTVFGSRMPGLSGNNYTFTLVASSNITPSISESVTGLTITFNGGVGGTTAAQIEALVTSTSQLFNVVTPATNQAATNIPGTGSTTYFFSGGLDIATTSPTSVEVPYGADERLVLGIARRANVKDSTRSSIIDKLIEDADAELAFTAAGRVSSDSPRVRRIPAWQRNIQKIDLEAGFGTFPGDPRTWFYP